MAYRKSANTRTDPKTGRRLSMWTKAKIRRLRDLYCRDGLSVEKTAAEFDCSPMAVYNKLQELGLNRRIPQLKSKTIQFLDNNRTKVLKKYKTMSAQEMATAGNLSLRGVIAWLKKEGVFVDGKSRIAKAIASKRHPAGYRFEHRLKEILSTDWSSSHPYDFKRAVGYVTTFSYRKFSYLIDPNNERSYEMHLDHIFSVKAALCKREGGKWVERDVRAPLWMIGHPANLRILSRAENARRHNVLDPESYSISALKTRIKKFENQHGKVFKDYV